MKLLLLMLFSIVCLGRGHVTDYGESSDAPLPTLYSKFNKFIVELDQDNFDDTVHCDPSDEDCTGFVVQFYKSNSPSSRVFLVPYVKISIFMYGWRSITKIGAINCGDEYNEDICDRHAFDGHPMLRYFGKASTDNDLGSPIDMTFDVEKVLDGIVTEVRRDYLEGRYKDWPNFEPLPNIYKDAEDLWTNALAGRHEMAMVVVEKLNEFLGMNELVTLHTVSGGLPIRLALKGDLIDKIMNGTEYPHGGVISYAYSMDEYCKNPELRKRKSVYGPMMEKLGMEFEKGDYQAPTYEGGSSVYKCKNSTSSSEPRHKRSLPFEAGKSGSEVFAVGVIPFGELKKEAVPNSAEALAMIQKREQYLHI